MRDTVYVLVFDGFADWQAALALCEVRRPGEWQVCTLGFSRAPVVGALFADDSSAAVGCGNAMTSGAVADCSSNAPCDLAIAGARDTAGGTERMGAATAAAMVHINDNSGTIVRLRRMAIVRLPSMVAPQRVRQATNND